MSQLARDNVTRKFTESAGSVMYVVSYRFCLLIQIVLCMLASWQANKQKKKEKKKGYAHLEGSRNIT